MHRQYVVKFSAPREFSIALDQVCADLRLSKSLVLREAVRRGLPALVNDVRFLRASGFRSSATLAGELALHGRRGDRDESVVSARWLETPDSRPVAEPVIPCPEVDED